MGESGQQRLQQGLQRIDGARTERQRGDAAPGSSRPRPATLLTAPPGNTPPSWEQPAFADHEVAGELRLDQDTRTLEAMARRGVIMDLRANRLEEAIMLEEALVDLHTNSLGEPTVLGEAYMEATSHIRLLSRRRSQTQDETLAPQLDPRPPATSSTGGRSRANGLSLSDILNAEPVREKSPARASSPRRKASPCNLAEDLSEGLSHDRNKKGENRKQDIPQPQPRSRDTEIDQSRGREIWSNHETQILKHVMSAQNHGDSHVYNRASTKLGNVRSPSACWRRWRELTTETKSSEKKAGKTPMNNAAWPPKQYDGEPALEQYHGFLASGWNVIDANKLHVLKHLDRRIKVKTLVLELGRKYSEESIRDHLLILHDNGFFTRKPPSRPWTSVDKALYKKRREKGASEDELMRACIRTREEIQEIAEHWGLKDTVMSSEGSEQREQEKPARVEVQKDGSIFGA